MAGDDAGGAPGDDVPPPTARQRFENAALGCLMLALGLAGAAAGLFLSAVVAFGIRRRGPLEERAAWFLLAFGTITMAATLLAFRSAAARLLPPPDRPAG